MAEDLTGEARTVTPRGLGASRFWLAAAAITLILFSVYWLFVRTFFVPVLSDLEPQNAADVAKVLDEKTIAYRFEDNGHTIAVASDQADKARVELAGSELPMRGQIGFELFNQSDMGLTEFAQKVNFQRALQGELARTILQFEDVQSVRVHLGMPERSLFSAEQVQTKAAVTLILKPGKSLSSATVSGIQRLVAGAVPNLSENAVAVLDGAGRIVSTAAPPFAEPDALSDAVVGNLRQRLLGEISKRFPDLRFGLNVSLRTMRSASPAQVSSAAEQSGSAGSLQLAPRGEPDFAYVIRITTEQPLADGLRSDLQNVVSEVAGFDQRRGDSLAYLVGPVIAEVTPDSAMPPPERIVARSKPPQLAESPWSKLDWSIAVLLVGLLAIAAGLLVWFNRSRKRRIVALGEFTELLQRRIEAEGLSQA